MPQSHSGFVIDRVLPNSLDAEMAVLGAMLLSPDECGVLIRAELTANHFYFAAHNVIFREISHVLDKLKTIDLITLTQRLQDAGELEGIGGPVYLSDLVARVPTTANVDHYIDIVKDKHLRRQLIGLGHDVVCLSFEDTREVEEIQGALMRHFGIITQGHSKIRTISEAAMDAINEYEEAMTRESNLLGLSTGFADLDYFTRGLEKGSTYYIAGRPSTGKSSLAACIALHVAEFEKVPVGVLSLEQTDRAVAKRMIASRAGVNMRQPKESTQEHRDAVVKALIEIKKLPIYFDDRGGMTLSQIRSTSRAMKSRYGCGLFILDHLQITRPETKGQRRYDQITEISAGVHDLAKELDAPYIVLSQLNRDVEKQERRPRLSDLRESGSIEQDADLIGLLHTDLTQEELRGWMKELPKDEQKRIVEFRIAKQREGPTVPIYFAFDKEYTRYRTLKPAEKAQKDLSWQEGPET